MTWLRSSQIDSQGLADSLVSTPSDSIMMFIPSYMPPGSAPLPYPQRSRSTLTEWNAWEWSPTWIIPLTGYPQSFYVLEANGKLCLCLDPHDLNEAICHDHDRTPTVDEVCPWVCTLLLLHKDGCPPWILVNCSGSGIQPAHYLYSPFRRYCFLCLPFGLVCSQDISQKKMDQILEECQVCIGIADDITVHGHTKVEHDACLQNLMCVACKYGLVFNPQKTHVKAPAVNFFGCHYDADGVHLDPDKVNAVHALPVPINVTELQGVLRHGNVPQSLHFWPVHLDCPSVWAAQKGHRLHLEPHLWFHIPACQGCHNQWHHPQVLMTLHFPWPYKLMPYR